MKWSLFRKLPQTGPAVTRPSVLALVFTAVFATGCATGNPSPPTPRGGYGYVDLYPASDLVLCWDVRQLGAGSNEFKRLYYDVKPLDDRVLRLALKPGRHSLGVSFLNLVVSEPGVAEVSVVAGKLTPVQVALAEVGQTTVRTESARLGPSFKSRFGRGVTITETQAKTYEVKLVPAEPVAYQKKELVAYPGAGRP